jgi:hypothetical protein
LEALKDLLFSVNTGIRKCEVIVVLTDLAHHHLFRKE